VQIDMAKANNIRNRRDIDISIPDGTQKTHWSVHAAIWGSVSALAIAMIVIEMPVEWALGIFVGVGVIAIGGRIAWVLIVRRGALTWMRLAYRPAKLFAAGDPIGAEAALTQAIERANRFAPGSQPRGMMLEPIAEYLGNQGRSTEAKAAFEECIDTLARFASTHPMDYFISLNNFAVLLLFHKDFESAQRILERVLDLALAAKKGNDGGIITVTDGQLQSIQFVLHLNLVCVFLEMQEADAMRYHLFETETFFDALPKGMRKQFHDHFIALRARCLFERKKYDAAWKQLEEAVDANAPNVVRMRGRLHLHEREFAEAESCFKRYEDSQRKVCVSHHPQHLDLRLHLAECEFQQGKFEAAFTSLEEARNLVTDFSLPRDSKYHEKLRPWLERAGAHGKTELVKALAEDVRQTAAESETAIAVLERFRALPLPDEKGS